MSPQWCLISAVGPETQLRFSFLKSQTVIGLKLSDKSLEVVRRTRAHHPVVYRLMTEQNLDGTIDLALCNGVFHHIPRDERKEALDHIAGRLRPSGILALWENSPWSQAVH